MRAVDATTVEFTLDRPDPAFFDKLQIGIAPAHMLEGKDIKNAAFNRKPVGTGPYVIKEFTPGGRIVMEANQDYFRGAPKIKRVVLTAVRDENARVALLEKGDDRRRRHRAQARRRRAQERPLQRARGAQGRCAHARAPDRDPVLRDPAVRRALSFAVDREAIVEGALAGAGRARVRPDHEGPLGLQPGRGDAV